MQYWPWQSWLQNVPVFYQNVTYKKGFSFWRWQSSSSLNCILMLNFFKQNGITIKWEIICIQSCKTTKGYWQARRVGRPRFQKIKKTFREAVIIQNRKKLGNHPKLSRHPHSPPLSWEFFKKWEFFFFFWRSNPPIWLVVLIFNGLN